MILAPTKKEEGDGADGRRAAGMGVLAKRGDGNETVGEAALLARGTPDDHGRVDTSPSLLTHEQRHTRGLTSPKAEANIMLWVHSLNLRQRKLKRAPRLLCTRAKAGGFLFGKSSATAHQSPSTPTQASTTSTICSTDRSLAVRGTATLRYLAPRGRANLTRQARIKHPREKLSSWAQQVGI